MNVICTINDKKKKKTYKLEELTPKQREEYGRKINESGMAAMGYVKSIFHLQPPQAVNGSTGRSLIGKIQTGYVPFFSPSQWHGTHFYILIHFCLKCGFKSRRPDSGQAVVPWHVKEMYITKHWRHHATPCRRKGEILCR